MNDKNFDNDDNPYGQFILHQYTNMKSFDDNSTENVTGGFYDNEVPLGLIKRDYEGKEWWEKSKIYEAKFDNHWIYGSHHRYLQPEVTDRGLPIIANAKHEH